MPYLPSDEFTTIIGEINASGTPKELTVRKLLELFRQERRTRNVVHWINHNIAKHGIECNPEIDSVYIDATVRLSKKTTVKASTKKGDQDKPDVGANNSEEEGASDPVARLALLPAANRTPTTVKRDADLSHAITLMLMYDFSQLPVMQNERDIDGMISWRSIVAAQNTGDLEAKVVRDCMEKSVEVLSHDTTLFEAVRAVMAKEVVLVKGRDKKIVGLVTIADIGQQFIDLAEPFLILEQVENHIRVFLDKKFTNEQLKQAMFPGDSKREVESISDLTFGEYIRLLEKPDNWQLLRINLDRTTFVKRLEDVKRIRNDVMHFHPDGISDKDKDMLRETSLFFQRISQFRTNAK